MSTSILDMVAIIGDYLRSAESVSDLVGERVGHKTPETLDDPWVRITQLDVRNVTGSRQVEYLVSYYLQIDFYAGRQNRYAEVVDLAGAGRAVLVDLPGAALEGAVVTDVGFSSMHTDSDPDIGRERIVLDAEIWAHPA